MGLVAERSEVGRAVGDREAPWRRARYAPRSCTTIRLYRIASASPQVMRIGSGWMGASPLYTPGVCQA